MTSTTTVRIAFAISCLTLCLALGLPVPSRAQEADPIYPKVNAAIGYTVDPAWPKRPDNVAVFGGVPGIAVDDQDQVWVFNRGEDPVQVYSSEGEFIRTWGRGTIASAHHMKIDHQGNVWLAVVEEHIVQKYTPTGELLLTLGTKGEIGRDESHFHWPTDMVVTPEGDIFVTDGYGNARIAHFDAKGKFLNQWGELGSKPGQFSLVHAIALDSRGRLYAADRNNARVQVFDQSGKLLDVWSNLITPWGFCMTRQDTLWVCGSTPTRWPVGDEKAVLGCPPKDQMFMRFGTDGKLLQLWSVPKGMDGFERPGDCNWVHSIAVDSKGNLYVGDVIGKRAQKFVREEAELASDQ